ncbi:MAG: hypothetical protein IPP94_15290 [Ignavibacteria bacterium]|nr:hypothetical protein [Ignavibacteria bacterium]
MLVSLPGLSHSARTGKWTLPEKSRTILCCARNSVSGVDDVAAGTPMIASTATQISFE